jgi:hypothetical protein
MKRTLGGIKWLDPTRSRREAESMADMVRIFGELNRVFKVDHPWILERFNAWSTWCSDYCVPIVQQYRLPSATGHVESKESIPSVSLAIPRSSVTRVRKRLTIPEPTEVISIPFGLTYR